MTRIRLSKLAMAGICAASALVATGAAYADNNERQTNDAAIIANAKTTMVAAIAAAEQQTGGKTVGTGIEDQDGTVYFEVQVLKGNQRQKVLVDPQTGKVVKTVMADNEQNKNGHEGNGD